MNISNAEVLLNEEDLLSILKDVITYGNIKGLEVSKVNYEEDLINIKGTYKFKIRIPFSIKLSFMYLKDNFLKLKINKISIAKLGIFSFIKNFALKKLLKDFMVIGIISHKGEVCLELNTLFTIVPYVSLILDEVRIEKDKLLVKVKEINVDLNKKYLKFEEAMKKNEKIQNVWELNPKKVKIQEDFTKKLNKDNKVEDMYSAVRNNIEMKTQEDYKDIVKCALVLPDLIALLYRLFKDPRVPKKEKIILGGVMGYIVMPIDIIPDKIPFVGKIDELALVFFSLDKIINSIPEEVVIQNWEGEENVILIIKEGISFINPMVGGENVAKIFSFIDSGFKGI